LYFKFIIGQRKFTCHGIEINDIENIKQLNDIPDHWTMKLKCRLQKGNPNSEHCVTIEGCPDTKSNIDGSLYYLI
jgi:hypothetical protein